MKKILIIAVSFIFLTISNVSAGTDGENSLSKKNSGQATDCFEKVNRGIFAFNQALDGAIFEPLAKGYRKLPVPIRLGTGNFLTNLSTLITIPNNLLQGEIKKAGENTLRFAVNTTLGILGIFDPASGLGFANLEKEDYGQTLATWGFGEGCYLVLPVLGPTTTRDALGLVGNVLIDPVYHLTHNSETDVVVGNENLSEHNYYYYKGTDAVDFRSKNIESIDSLEKNSIDFYASVKSLYLQNRAQKISNSPVSDKGQDDSDWEEIDNQ